MIDIEAVRDGNEGLPAEPEDGIFYVFANTADYMCWHNLRFTKRMTSAGFAAATTCPKFRESYLNGTASYAPFVPNQGLSSGLISRFTMNVSANYRLEYDAECIRYQHFATSPSRFSATFAFGHQEDCQKASQIYKWDLNEVRKFRLLRDGPLTRVRRVNMEVVSLMRSVYAGASWSEDERSGIWKHYWSGGGGLAVEVPAIENDTPTRRKVDCGEIWEYLIEGRLQLID
ncbi:MAG TPA: hypothetical protein VND19_17420 [Acetobacteraceae bacterium]|nr:hypothetical protein [Acetobacteraceae bacterium]